MNCLLQGLKEEELSSYCSTRLSLAGCQEDIFQPSAIHAIYGVTKGFPRLVNNLATNALLYASSKNLRVIDEEVIYQAQSELSL